MQVIKFLIDPFNLFWFLFAATFFIYFTKKTRLYSILVYVTVSWFLLISTPLLPTFLLSSLENRFMPVSVEELDPFNSDYHIVVLGGGHEFGKNLPANSLLSGNALGRLNEGIRLHRQLPNSYLIMSGSEGSTPISQAQLLRQTALLLGVSEEKIFLQEEPHNTYNEAAAYSGRFDENAPVILVTSASHMPRAVMLFRSFGIEVIPSPTNFQLKENNNVKWIGLPSMHNISYLKRAIYEYSAIFRYRLFKN